MAQQIIDLEISSPNAAPGAANMQPTESIVFSRGPQSLDRSVWYNGSLMTFLATGEETQGQFALIEAVARRGNVPPPHIHHREDEIFYVLEGEIVVSVGDRTIRGTAGTVVFLPRDVPHSFTIESEQSRMLILLTPAGLEGWFKEFSVPAPAMTLPPAGEPEYRELQSILEAAPRYGIEFLDEASGLSSAKSGTRMPLLHVPTVKLDIAFWNYDRTRALSDGKVRIPGVDAKYHSGSNVAEIFRGMVAEHRFDVSELGLTYFLRTFKAGESPFVAIPVFPVRAFRHSAIFVNTSSGINKPEDLNGKTIGELALYSHDAGIVPKGILMEEFGFKPETCRWLIGGLDWPLKPIDFVPHMHPANVKVADVPSGKDLGAMLDAGEIDALISADPPKCMLEHSPRVRRLFQDCEKVERDYYKRTGIFPIMHTVVIRRQLLKEHPGIAKVVYKGFCDAKKAAEDKYRLGLIFNNMDTMFPWFSQLIEEDISVLGEDWWPYGIGANRKALESVLRYHAEQGITHRHFSIEDVFVPELLVS